MNFWLLLKKFCWYMIKWLFIFHIWLLDFHTLHFVIFLRIQHYISHDDVAWHMDTHWPLWWPLRKLQLQNNDMDFMMRWKFQVIFLATLSSIFMKDLINTSCLWKVQFVSHFHPPKGLGSTFESYESSCNVFFVSSPMICFMSSW